MTSLRDDSRTTQNSGVRVPSVDGHDFYGKMEDVIVMKYTNSCRVILFKCQWFGDNDPKKRIYKDEIFGTTSVYVAKKWYQDEPFILATQARQIFYLKDLHNDPQWEIVEESHHRHVWDVPDIEDRSTSQLVVQPTDLEQLSICRDTGLPEVVITDVIIEEDIIVEDDDFIDDEELDQDVFVDRNVDRPDDVDDDLDLDDIDYVYADDE